MIVNIWPTRIKRIYSATNSTGVTINQPITDEKVSLKFQSVVAWSG